MRINATRAVIGGSITGLVHSVVSLLLWNYFRFEDLTAAFSTEPFYVAYVLTGMVALGFIPGVFYSGRNIILPAILTVVLLVVSGFRTWQIVSSGATPVDPTPYGWYILLWIGVVAAASLAGGLELKLRQRSTV